jgi:hypothetical protein
VLRWETHRSTALPAEYLEFGCVLNGG